MVGYCGVTTRESIEPDFMTARSLTVKVKTVDLEFANYLPVAKTRKSTHLTRQPRWCIPGGR